MASLAQSGGESKAAAFGLALLLGYWILCTCRADDQLT